jgi:hypothetical protein
MSHYDDPNWLTPSLFRLFSLCSPFGVASSLAKRFFRR